MILRELRKEKGLTMKQVAEMSGISESTISLYERGLRNPSVNIAARLADSLGVSLDRLMKHKKAG